jgi:hypothetical protein
MGVLLSSGPKQKFDYFGYYHRHSFKNPSDRSLLESQFISVFSGHLQAIIGLSDQEISELADYFRVQDGRIFYTQLCEVIYDSGTRIIHSNCLM